MESARVRMTLTWSVPAGEMRSLAAALHGLMVVTRSEPGCSGCSLSTDLGTRAVIHYAEDWKTEEDLKRQLRSHRFAVLVELMEHSTEQPTIEFALADRTRGLDYAEEVRGSDGG